MDHALTVVAKPLVASEANHRCGLALASLAQFEHFRHLAVYLLMGAACSTKKVRRKNSLRDLMEQRNLDNLIDQWPQTYLLMLKSKFNAVSTQSGLDHNSFRKLFPNLRSTKISLHVFSSFDLDCNGRLDFKEFCQMLSFIQNSDESDRQLTLFHFYDLDQDGELSRAELEFFSTENRQFLVETVHPDFLTRPMTLSGFREWCDKSFKILHFFEIFELLPGPLKERERMREILLKPHEGKYYVISYKWWELWRFYINYNFAHKPAQTHQDVSILDIEIQELDPKSNQGHQGLTAEEFSVDPKNPKMDIKHGICDSANNNQHLLPLEEPQSLRPGPIDNSDIQGEFQGELRLNILNNHDYLTLPEQAWLLLVQWYGCLNNLQFKRRDYLDPKHNIKIIDLYPPLLRGHSTSKNGTISFKKQFTFMVSLRQTMECVARKLAKRFKLKNLSDYYLYYMKVGQSWQLAQLDMTLFDESITSGTFVTLIQKNTRPCSYVSTFQKELGQIVDVQHPISNEWLSCHICNFTEDFTYARMHIQKESYTREFNIYYHDMSTRIQSANTRNSKDQVQIICPNVGGLSNLGNTCFMNTVLQCLINTPYFDEYLFKQAYKQETRKSLKSPLLIEELSRVAVKLRELKERTISPEYFKRAIDQLIPQFSGYEQHDAQEFLNILLDQISDELKGNSSRVRQSSLNNSFSNDAQESILKILFTGKTINIMECQQCHKTSQKVEEFYTLSLPIPPNDEINMFIIFFKKCTGTIYPLIRYGIKLSKYSQLKDIYIQLEKVSGMPSSKFELAEIYRSHIHRQFQNYDPKTPIRQIGLKANCQLYAYEIQRGQKEVEEDFKELTVNTPIKDKDFQPQDFIDLEDKQGEWKHGKVNQLLDKNGEKQYRVVTKFCLNQPQLAFFHHYQIAPFRSKVIISRNKLFLTPVIHRMFNQTTECMEKFAIPFLIIIPTFQLTWFELKQLVFQQAKRFIDFEYLKKKKLMQKQSKDSRSLYPNNYRSVHDDITSNNLPNYRSGYAGQNNDEEDQRKRSHRKTEQDLEEFQTRNCRQSNQIKQDDLQLLNESGFPYKIRLLDSNNFCCLACDKQTNYQHKLIQVCQGCEIDPLLLQINHHHQQPVIALDWIDSLAFNPHSNMPENDESYIKIHEDRAQRRDRIIPEQCFQLLTQEEKLEIQCEKCASKQPTIMRLWLETPPNILIMHLKRFQFRDGFLEKIETDINFPFKQLNLKQWLHNKNKDQLYDLYAVANHFGNGLYGHYTTYILKVIDGKEVWVHCDDEQIRSISPEKVFSQFAYLLFYRKREIPTSVILNLTYKH